MRCPRCHGQRKVMLIGYMEDDCPKCDGTGIVHGEEKTNDERYQKTAESFLDYDLDPEPAELGTTTEWALPISEQPTKRRGRPRKEQ